MNNYLREWQKTPAAWDDCASIHRENLALIADALDDTYEGFSNRETWAAVQLAREGLSEGESFDFTIPGAIELWAAGLDLSLTASVGSLWRVNWQEVAAALKGGEG